MFLFRSRAPQSRPGQAHAPAAGPLPVGGSTAADVLPAPAIKPRSAAEWAIAELLIRLCNRGRALRPTTPEPPTTE